MQAFLKQLEYLGKKLLALLLGLLLWRPNFRRRARERLKAPKTILLVRLDNRVGEAVLMTPLFATLRKQLPQASVHILAHPRVARVHERHPLVHEVLALDGKGLLRGRGFGLLSKLRKRNYDVVVNCSNWSAPSVTNAIVSRLVGPKSAVIGPDAPFVARLHSHVQKPLNNTSRESLQRLHFLSPLLAGAPVLDELSYRQPEVGDKLREFLQDLSPETSACLYPGGRLAYRRVPLQAFVRSAQKLLEQGLVPVVAWGPGEKELALEIVKAAPGSLLAPPTTLDELAALIAHCRLMITNNTGPMHLSVAVGTPTFQLFRLMDPERWGHPAKPHRMVELTVECEDLVQLEAAVERELSSWLAELQVSTAVGT